MEINRAQAEQLYEAAKNINSELWSSNNAKKKAQEQALNNVIDPIRQLIGSKLEKIQVDIHPANVKLILSMLKEVKPGESKKDLGPVFQKAIPKPEVENKQKLPDQEDINSQIKLKQDAAKKLLSLETKGGILEQEKKLVNALKKFAAKKGISRDAPERYKLLEKFLIANGIEFSKEFSKDLNRDLFRLKNATTKTMNMMANYMNNFAPLDDLVDENEQEIKDNKKQIKTEKTQIENYQKVITKLENAQAFSDNEKIKIKAHKEESLKKIYKSNIEEFSSVRESNMTNKREFNLLSKCLVVLRRWFGEKIPLTFDQLKKENKVTEQERNLIEPLIKDKTPEDALKALREAMDQRKKVIDENEPRESHLKEFLENVGLDFSRHPIK